MRVGILALQGAVAPHAAKLAALGAEAVTVRTAAELERCAGLIVPGGESTTMLKLIDGYALREPLAAYAAGHTVWGVCAGAILMARTVENPSQFSFGWLPITVRRNAYGRQNESFIAPLSLRLPGQAPGEQEGVFIRAPQVVAWDPEVEVLAEYQGLPVALQAGHHLATTFHPELSPPDALHRHFLALCGAAPALVAAQRA